MSESPARATLSTPPAVAGLIFVCLLAYVAQVISGAHWWDAASADLLRLGANYAPAVAAGEVWRLPVSIVLHGGLLHLALNMLALADIGPVVARRLGSARTLAAFTVSGMVGALVSTARHGAAISVGASGAIFGLFGIWLLLAQRGNAFVEAPARRRRRLIGLGLYATLALGSGFLLPGVDNAAHFGGFAAGLVLGFAVTAHDRGNARFWGGCTLLLALTAGAVATLPDSWAEPWRAEQRFVRVYREFVLADRAISAKLQALGRDAKAGRIDEAAAMQRLDREILPPLATWAARWRDEAFADAAIDKERALWVEYSRLRLEAATALRSALASGDRGLARVFEKKMAAAARLVGLVSKRQGAESAPAN